MNQFLNKLAKSSAPKQLNQSIQFGYHFPSNGFGQVGDNPGLTAKRIIKCVGEKLREVDPQRWESVPVTFKTHFRDEAGFACLHTSIHVHDALEREFNIDVKDKQVLVTDVETAFYVVMSSHDAL